MIEPIKDILKSLYQNVKEEFHKTPIQALAASVAIFGVMLAIMTSLFLKVLPSNHVTKILLKTREINILLVGLSVALLILALIALRRQHAKNSYEFFDYLNFSWKIFSPTSQNFKVDFPPYCPEHKAQYIEIKSNYICPICGNERIKNVGFHNLYPMKEAVESVIQARNSKHLKI